MPQYPRVLTLAQWAGGSNWALELQHSEHEHALIWQTRGQSRCVIEGVRRGRAGNTHGLGQFVDLAKIRRALFRRCRDIEKYKLIDLSHIVDFHRLHGGTDPAPRIVADALDQPEFLDRR